jgi:Skp family chaperone for outer membrane proteins
MKYYFVISIALLLLCFSSGSWAEEYYTWTDDDGNVHMSNNPSDVPTKKTIKKHAFDEAPPEQRKAERREQDYKNQMDSVKSDYERQREQARYEAEKREKAWNKERCESARRSEKLYRHNWINAKTDRSRMYWKRELDEIEATCKKADE